MGTNLIGDVLVIVAHDDDKLGKQRYNATFHHVLYVDRRVMRCICENFYYERKSLACLTEAVEEECISKDLMRMLD